MLDEIFQESSFFIPTLHVSREYFIEFVEHFDRKDSSKLNIQNIQKAISFADRIHNGQYRLMGNNYLEGHLLPVALEYCIHCTVNNTPINEDTLISVILHDTVEDSGIISPLSIYSHFGYTVYKNVTAMTKKHHALFPGETESEQKLSRDGAYMLQLLAAGREVCIIKSIDLAHNLSCDNKTANGNWATYVSKVSRFFPIFLVAGYKAQELSLLLSEEFNLEI